MGRHGPCHHGRGTYRRAALRAPGACGIGGHDARLLTCLGRGSVLMMNTDLGKIAQDMRMLAPDYFLNVPALLERLRRAVDEQLWQAGGFVQAIYSRAKTAWVRKNEKRPKALDWFWL